MVPTTNHSLVVSDEAFGLQQLIKTSAIRANIIPLASVIDKEAAGAGNPGVIAVVLALELGIREAGLDRRGDTKGVSADDVALGPRLLGLVSILECHRRHGWGVADSVSGRHDGRACCAGSCRGSRSWGLSGRERESCRGDCHDRQHGSQSEASHLD